MKDTNPQLIQIGRGFSILYRDKWLYSKRKPVENCQKLCDRIKLNENTFYIIPSPLLCYGVDSLINKLPKNSSILFLEYDQKLMSLTNQEWKCKYSNNNVKSIRSDNIDLIYNTCLELGLEQKRKVEQISINNGYLINKDFYDSICFNLQELLQNSWRNRMTSIELGKRWIYNIYRNISEKKIIPLEKEYNSATFLVIGAGPSLDLDINKIKKIKNRVVILSVDTAVKRLVQDDIIPDYILNLDGQIYNLYDFFGTRLKTSTIINDLTAYPNSIESDNRNLFYISEFSEKSFLKQIIDSTKLPSFKPFGSVGPSAIAVAKFLGATNLIFSGLDFGFPAAEKSHSKCSLFHLHYLYKHKRNNPFHLIYNPKKTKKVRDLYTTNELLQYCDQTLNSCSSIDSYLLSKQSLLDIPIIDNDLLESKIVQKETKKTDIETIDYNNYIEFIYNQLDSIITDWDLFSSGACNNENKLWNDIYKVEQCWYFFPEGFKKGDISFLTRAVYEARKLKRILKRKYK